MAYPSRGPLIKIGIPRGWKETILTPLVLTRHRSCLGSPLAPLLLLLVPRLFLLLSCCLLALLAIDKHKHQSRHEGNNHEALEDAFVKLAESAIATAGVLATGHRGTARCEYEAPCDPLHGRRRITRRSPTVR